MSGCEERLGLPGSPCFLLGVCGRGWGLAGRWCENEAGRGAGGKRMCYSEDVSAGETHVERQPPGCLRRGVHGELTRGTPGPCLLAGMSEDSQEDALGWRCLWGRTLRGW